MENLKEIRINDTNLLLNGNMVKGGILPAKAAELTRMVTIQERTVIDGPVYAAKFNVEKGDAEVTGAVFVQKELYVSNSATGSIIFRKAVASATGVTSRAMQGKVSFCSDINAKQVLLTGAFVCGSIYADNIELDNCVVIGGVFASNSLDMRNCIVGTFNAPNVTCDGIIQLLLPTAFSQQPMNYTPATRLYNLSLADLGGLFRGNPQAPDSGRIEMNVEADDIKTTLTDENSRKSLHSYTVVGKVLAADMLDIDKFQNHFLLTAAALGPQLLNTYDLGTNADGTTQKLTTENIREFFFKILNGQVAVQPLSGSYSIAQLARD